MFLKTRIRRPSVKSPSDNKRRSKSVTAVLNLSGNKPTHEKFPNRKSKLKRKKSQPRTSNLNRFPSRTNRSKTSPNWFDVNRRLVPFRARTNNFLNCAAKRKICNLSRRRNPPNHEPSMPNRSRNPAFRRQLNRSIVRWQPSPSEKLTQNCPKRLRPVPQKPTEKSRSHPIPNPNVLLLPNGRSRHRRNHPLQRPG